MARRPKTLDDNIDAIRADLAALRSAVGALNAESSRAAGAMTKTARRFARNTSDAGSDIWERSLDLGADSARAVQAAFAALKQQLRQNPVATALVAIGVGFLISTLRSK